MHCLQVLFAFGKLVILPLTMPHKLPTYNGMNRIVSYVIAAIVVIVWLWLAVVIFGVIVSLALPVLLVFLGYVAWRQYNAKRATSTDSSQAFSGGDTIIDAEYEEIQIDTKKQE